MNILYNFTSIFMDFGDQNLFMMCSSVVNVASSLAKFTLRLGRLTHLYIEVK